MKHFQDEEYDSMKEYETNLLNHADDYKDGDYYGNPIIHYEDYDSMKDYEFNTFNHPDEEYDSMKDYEFNIFNHND